ncbi:MAG: cytochrome c3 family protein [bacterium]|nr:cytochrome c3 family protein [bacterium]
MKNEDCLTCHSDPDFKSESGKAISVDSKQLAGSVHALVSCYDCHKQSDANFEEYPHFKQYQPVDCQSCHQLEYTTWMEYFYKMLKKKGEQNIPDCRECHGTHDAQRRMSMKIVCERCHQEIAEKYKQSYHFQKYQEDQRKYPICTTCHDPHFKSKKEVMSEIEYKQEIVDICTKCHQRDIETYIHSRHFHELEGGNAKAPVCTSCHEKHDIRKPTDINSSVNTIHISDVCNGCHPGHKESLHHAPGQDPGMISCATCHTGHQTDMTSINNEIFKEGGIFNRCNYCHSTERHTKENLAHGEIMMLDVEGKEANCTLCHIYHYKLPGANTAGMTSSRKECINCHAKENREYKNSIHGKAYLQGITAAPTCQTCHGEKDIRKVSEQFTPEGIIKLCSRCHSDRNLMLKFQINPYVVEGYQETYHGKLLEMGNVDKQFAVCTNCHSVHSILPPDDPKSSVNRDNIVKTCKQCHPRANDRFVSYLVHPKKPSSQELAYGKKLAEEDTVLSRLAKKGGEGEGEGVAVKRFQAINTVVAGFMTVLLFGVLGLFGFHTLLWFQRGIRGRFVIRGAYYRRIDGFHSFLHILVNLSFLTLAFTGLPQSYAHTELAKWLFHNVMTLKTAQTLHYIAAGITGFYFLAHLIFLIIKTKKIGVKAMVTGPNTLAPRWKDVTDFIGHIKWFLGKGPLPKFDRWTYWEKFDYIAVFWGVVIIGVSGLLRLNEEFFGSILGGGIISLADTIHKEEALLATAFIFFVHFFNTHLRAEKFPMDISVYTGSISEEEFQHERPIEWERLKANGELDKYRVKPASIFRHVLAYAWGILTLSLGLFLLALILIGQFTAR